MGYITIKHDDNNEEELWVSKLFRAYGLYNIHNGICYETCKRSFKALSSLWVI